jgi:hypothetical protein
MPPEAWPYGTHPQPLTERPALGDSKDWSRAGQTPVLAVDETGNAIIAWQALNTVHAVRYDPAHGFSGVVDTNEMGGSASLGGVAANSGNLMVLVGYDAGRYDEPPLLMARLYDKNRGWLELGQVGRLLSQPSSWSEYIRPVAALLPNGRALAMWTESEGRDHLDSVYANAFDPEIGWGHVGSLSAGTSIRSSWNSFFRVEGVGNATAVWRGGPADGGYGFYANQYQTGTGWVPAEGIPSSWRYDLLSSSRDGGFYGSGEAAGSLTLAKYTRGVGWGPLRVLGDRPAADWSPLAVFEGEGESWLALWMISNERNCDQQIWSSGGSASDWSKPALFEGHAARPVAKSRAGATAVAWLGLTTIIDGRCELRSVHLRRFDQTETLELDRLQAPGYMKDLALEMMPDGSALVAWTRVPDGLSPEVRVRLVSP